MWFDTFLWCLKFFILQNQRILIKANIVSKSVFGPKPAQNVEILLENGPKFRTGNDESSKILDFRM